MQIKSFKIKFLLVIILLVCMIVNGIFITLYNVDKSVNIGIISEEMGKLAINNDKLIENISSRDSLTEFLKLSQSSGYTQDVKILYFDKAGAVAQAR